MDEKSLTLLEFDKVRQQLAAYTAFSASRALALQLLPSGNWRIVQHLQAQTSEARLLLADKPDVRVGGARDVRDSVGLAARGGVLQPTELLDIKSTLVAAREQQRFFARQAQLYPTLSDIVAQIADLPGLIELISQVLDDEGEVRDSASPTLARLRAEARIVYDRLLDKLQHLINNPDNAQYLQEAIVTQRSDRFVIPLKANFKGRIRGVVHDQSASGATLFIEPLVTVELNNQWRELQLAAQQEINRILAALSAEIGAKEKQIALLVAALALLDLALAKAKYANDYRATQPRLLPCELRAATSTRSHPGSVIALQQVRHPLLDPNKVVAIDVELPPDAYVLVITGPNTGGKTVSLKTVGLAVLMAQSGMHILAERGATLSVFRQIFADIGDEQSIEQSLSTFSGHITNINRILRQVDEQSLLILDELGAGTDPVEGAALARALLNFVLDKGVTTLGTTHYPELKAYAHSTPGVVNGSVEFDLKTLAPTYRLLIGLPGRSNALAIAARLGLDDSIIAEARSFLGNADLQTDTLLGEIHKQRDRIQKEANRAAAIRADVEKLQQRLQARLNQIETERQAILAQAHTTAQAEIDTLQSEIRQMRQALQAAGIQPNALQALQEKARELNAALQQTTQTRSTSNAGQTPATENLPDNPRRALRLQDRVQVGRLNAVGTVIGLTTTEADVQVGRLRVRVPLDDLQRVDKNADAIEHVVPDSLKRTANSSKPESPGLELDLRGQRVEAGIEALEKYLDAAVLAALPWVRIIHGKGTGQMRKAVRDFLRQYAGVKQFKDGESNEGGDGVTVAKLST